jgi:hypothetical protein
MIPVADSPLRPRRRRRQPFPIPSDLKSKIRQFAAELVEQHGEAFSRERQLKSRLAAALRRLLRPRRSGRPAIVGVSAAIRVRARLKRSHPEWTPKEIWRQVYISTIPEWNALPAFKRREEACQLRQRVRWRMAARRRRGRRTNVTENKI